MSTLLLVLISFPHAFHKRWGIHRAEKAYADINTARKGLSGAYHTALIPNRALPKKFKFWRMGPDLAVLSSRGRSDHLPCHFVSYSATVLFPSNCVAFYHWPKCKYKHDPKTLCVYLISVCRRKRESTLLNKSSEIALNVQTKKINYSLENRIK